MSVKLHKKNTVKLVLIVANHHLVGRDIENLEIGKMGRLGRIYSQFPATKREFRNRNGAVEKV